MFIRSKYKLYVESVLVQAEQYDWKTSVVLWVPVAHANSSGRLIEIEYVPNRLLLQADEYAAALLQVWSDRVILWHCVT
jgi:hypothetical protein